MAEGVATLTIRPTREEADWAAQLLRRHDAFRAGRIVVEGPQAEPASHALPADAFRVLYTGPIRHTGVRYGNDRLDPDAVDFHDRASADRACARAREEISAGDLSTIHVVGDSDAGPWRLVWVYASVTLDGEPTPPTPRRQRR